MNYIQKGISFLKPILFKCIFYFLDKKDCLYIINSIIEKLENSINELKEKVPNSPLKSIFENLLKEWINYQKEQKDSNEFQGGPYRAPPKKYEEVFKNINFSHKISIINTNLIDLTNQNTNITKNELKEIIKKYIEHIEKIKNQNTIIFNDTVLISHYYDNLCELLKVINGKKDYDIIYNKNKILRVFIKDHEKTINENPHAIKNMQVIIKKGINNILETLEEQLKSL